MTSVKKSVDIKDTVTGSGLKTVPETKTTASIQKSTGINQLVTVKRGEMTTLT